MATPKLDTIDSAIDFLTRISSEDVVIVKFKKVDGTDRIMRCTLNFARIPKEDRPKSVSLKDILSLIKKNKILRVYDIEKMGWRSVPFDRTEYLKTNSKMYSIQQVKDIFKK